MFLNHFGLDHHPFLLTPDPRFLFMSDQHRDAMAHMSYILQSNSGFLAMTGEVGTGKTTLCRAVLARLPEMVEVALILNPKLTVVELLETICEELGMACPGISQGAKALFDALNQHLLEKLAQGHRTVLILDEAQGLSVEILEQLRLLTNLETFQEKLLQIILIGQPELETMLRRRELRQLAQRITAYFRIGPLRQAETVSYIRHRLTAAGWQGPDIFSRTACHWIHRLSRGTPRVINRICERAMLMAFAHHRRTVSAWMAITAGMECLLPLAPRWVWSALLEFGAYGLILLGILGLGVGVATGHLTITQVTDQWHALTHWQILDTPSPIKDTSSIPSAKTQPEPELPTSAPAVMKSVPTPVTEPTSAQIDSGPQTTRPDQNLSFPSQHPPLPETQVASTQSPPPSLEALLTNADAASAFQHLLALWGHPKVTANGCDQVRVPGLTCYTLRGSWTTLQTMNRPVVMQLHHPKRQWVYAVLTALTRDSATLWLANGETVVPLVNLEAMWEGSFAVISQMPLDMIFPTKAGAENKKIAWLRSRLAALQWYATPEKKNDAFDATLRQRLIGFQRQHHLEADGLLGEQTLVALHSTPLDPQGPDLGQRLSLPMLLQGQWNGSSETNAYKALFGAWGVTSEALPTKEWCGHATRLALECYLTNGSWNLLRRLDLPAILHLTAPDGSKYYTVVERLDDQQAGLRFGSWRGKFAIEELEPFWLGKMVLLWKTPPGQRKIIQLGDTGESVLWLRNHLEAIQGPANPPPNPELFDEALHAQLMAFQKTQSIPENGVASGLTLMLLQAAVQDKQIPSLTKSNSAKPGMSGER
ncbi:MAG: AAA family ATPase [Magnetococcales bacterium]|nr:AAA family ATPase [Magnetococcales bacterium]